LNLKEETKKTTLALVVIQTDRVSECETRYTHTHNTI